jgi:hypothetical protein
MLEYENPRKKHSSFAFKIHPNLPPRKKTQNRFQLCFEVIRLCDNKNMPEDNDMPDPPTHFNNMVFVL